MRARRKSVCANLPNLGFFDLRGPGEIRPCNDQGVIASDRLALEVGSSKLVVDGTDETFARKAEFSLSPGRSKTRALEALVEWSRDVYNGTLEHRREAWRRS